MYTWVLEQTGRSPNSILKFKIFLPCISIQGRTVRRVRPIVTSSKLLWHKQIILYIFCAYGITMYSKTLSFLIQLQWVLTFKFVCTVNGTLCELSSVLDKLERPALIIPLLTFLKREFFARNIVFRFNGNFSCAFRIL